MCGTSFKRLHHRDTTQGCLADVKNDGVPVGGHDCVRVTLEALTAKKRSGCRWRFADRGQHSRFCNNALGLQAREQRSFRAKIVILKDERGDAWVIELTVVTLPVRVDELVFGNPVELTRKRSRFTL